MGWVLLHTAVSAWESAEETMKVIVSPSGSLNLPCDPCTYTFWCRASIVTFPIEDGTGARLVVTVNVNVSVTVALPSVAVTVMVVDPFAFPVRVRVDPDTLTVALLVSEEVAV